MSRMAPYRTPRGKLVCGCILAIPALLGCSPEPTSQSESPVESIESGFHVRDARVHLMAQVAAVYLEVANGTDEPERLLRVESRFSTEADLHETVDDDGIMRMRPRPDGLAIPARGTLSLEPGGAHIMLLEPSIGEDAKTVPLVLVFERSGPVEIEAIVKRF